MRGSNREVGAHAKEKRLCHFPDNRDSGTVFLSYEHAGDFFRKYPTTDLKKSLPLTLILSMTGNSQYFN